jgi:hypothetical protein
VICITRTQAEGGHGTLFLSTLPRLATPSPTGAPRPRCAFAIAHVMVACRPALMREDDMPSKTHLYRPVVEWTGNAGSGTTDYRAYERSHAISVAGKADILGSSDRRAGW